jgi:glycerophosphoryl diester phosphodiesterase
VVLFRTLCPTLRTSGTCAERAATRAAREADDPTFVTHQLVSQPAFIADDGTRRITDAFLDFAHRHDIAVLTWVVDDPDDLQDLIEMGIDGIYTRRPDLMIDLLRDSGLL